MRMLLALALVGCAADPQTVPGRPGAPGGKGDGANVHTPVQITLQPGDRYGDVMTGGLHAGSSFGVVAMMLYDDGQTGNCTAGCVIWSSTAPDVLRVGKNALLGSGSDAQQMFVGVSPGTATLIATQMTDYIYGDAPGLGEVGISSAVSVTVY